jgi:hypothetical protein
VEPFRWEPCRWRRSGLLWVAAAVVVFLVNYRLAATKPVDSDGASNVLQAADLLHGNLLLRHWQVSDVSFYLTDLPLYAVLALIFGTAPAVVHVGAAVMFTAVVLLSAALARGRATGRAALIRALLAGGIVFGAPHQLMGIKLLLSSPDHLSTVVTALLVLLVADRTRLRYPVVIALATLAVISDLLTVVVLILPMALVCGLRAVRGLPGSRQDAALAGCAVASVPLALAVEALLRAFGGFTTYFPETDFAPAAQLFNDLTITYQQLLTLFGADFTGMRLAPDVAGPMLHLAGLVLAIAGVAVTARRFDQADRIEQILLAGTVANLAAFTLTTQAGATQSAREFLPVLAFSAVLAARRFAEPLTRLRLLPALAAVLAGYLAVTAVALRQGQGHVDLSPGLGNGTNSAAVAGWLRQHGLTYGLGSYWNASGVTVQSRDTVRVRPVLIGADGRLAVMDTEFDRTWYDENAHQATFLVVRLNDTDVTNAAQAEYGPPTLVANVAASTILVWPRNLLPIGPSPLR